MKWPSWTYVIEHRDGSITLVIKWWHPKAWYVVFREWMKQRVRKQR